MSEWLNLEIESLERGKPTAENYPESLKLIENKITEIEIDFSKPFEKKPNKMNAEVLQALIPCKFAGQDRVFWLNISNPLYAQIVRDGRDGKTKFKILRTGTQKNTRYTIVE